MFQEDVPEEFASHILNFISRNKIGANGVEVSYPRLFPLFYIHSLISISFLISH